MVKKEKKRKYKPDAEDEKYLDTKFRYHKPFVDQPVRYAEIQEAAKLMTQTIMEKVPKTHERQLAIEAIKVGVFWAKEGIDRNEMPL